MLKEFLTLGASARFYAALARSVRTEVAAHFGVTTLHVFDSQVPGFVDLRNVCAHHDRLFNRRFQKQPKRLQRAAIPIAPPLTSKAQFECLDYALADANTTAKHREPYPESAEPVPRGPEHGSRILRSESLQISRASQSMHHDTRILHFLCSNRRR